MSYPTPTPTGHTHLTPPPFNDSVWRACTPRRNQSCIIDPAAAYVLHTVQTCCLAASGAPNSGKLRLYRVVASAGGPRLSLAVVTTPCCTIRSTTRDFHLAHLPLLSSRAVPSQYLATERILRRLAAAFRRHCVDLTLALRCIAAYALPKLDFLHGASPPRRLPCLRIQRLVNNAIRTVLRLPASCPVRWLRAAPEHGGLGVPDVWLRAHLHLLRQFYDALGSRNLLIRSNLRHMWTMQSSIPRLPPPRGDLAFCRVLSPIVCSLTTTFCDKKKTPLSLALTYTRG